MLNLTEQDIMRDWKNNEIVVSINTLAYNHEKYIAQCIEGILMQKTNFAFELLIHDDASTDKTADIIREYEKKYPNIVKPIYQIENQWSKKIKISSTHQYPRAKGKYIAFCEGDDYWIDKNKLQIQVDFLENNPEYGMCFHGAIEHYEDGSIPDRVFSKLKTKKYTANEIIKHWIIPTASVVIRGALLNDDLYARVSSDKRIIYGDITLFIFLGTRSKIWCSSEVMSVYRRHEGGVVFSFSFEREYKSCVQDEALMEYFPDVKYALSRRRMMKSAMNCGRAVFIKDWHTAFCFFKLNVFVNLFLVPAFLVKNLYRKSKIVIYCKKNQ